MDMPKRIQRKRTKGWKMPKNAVYVGRNSTYGNWHVVGENGTAQECVEKYKRDIKYWASKHPLEYKKWISRLTGKDLACWCSLDQPCHADVLLQLANPNQEISGLHADFIILDDPFNDPAAGSEARKALEYFFKAPLRGEKKGIIGPWRLNLDDMKGGSDESR